MILDLFIDLEFLLKLNNTFSHYGLLSTNYKGSD